MNRQERPHRPRRFGSLEALETRSLMTIAASAPLPAVNLTTGTASTPVQLDQFFKDSAPANDYAIFNTSLGTIPVLLTPQTTPATVANFLGYVNKGAYTNTVVHRSVPGFIWQAGGYSLSSTGVNAIPEGSPVKNEYGAPNVRGTIAMAKLGSDPNSATNEFFFNEVDNSSNLDNQNGGFTVFGHVVSPQGLAVMDAVAAVPVPASSPLASPLDSAPLLNYTIGQTVQPSNFVLINSITTAGEVFTATSDSTNIATATVNNDALTITPLSAGTAHITVTGYGSDGNPATESFAVNVTGPTVAAPPTTTTGTATPTSTPTTPTATTTPASVFTPTARGAVPASVVAGGKGKIQQTVALSDPSGAIAQKEQVALALSPDGTTMETIATKTAKIKLKAGKQASVTVGTSHLAASTPAGTYQLMVTVTDPNGATTTINTGKTVDVLAARSK